MTINWLQLWLRKHFGRYNHLVEEPTVMILIFAPWQPMDDNKRKIKTAMVTTLIHCFTHVILFCFVETNQENYIVRLTPKSNPSDTFLLGNVNVNVNVKANANAFRVSTKLKISSNQINKNIFFFTFGGRLISIVENFFANYWRCFTQHREIFHRHDFVRSH